MRKNGRTEIAETKRSREDMKDTTQPEMVIKPIQCFYSGEKEAEFTTLI